MNDVKISKSNEVLTGNGEPIRIFSYNCSKCTSYSLYKTFLLDSNNKFIGEIPAYYMLIYNNLPCSSDKFPLILSEELVKQIINNPEEGSNIAYNIWMNRNR